jgi:ABC-2 type transport system permease protein/ribosome-dependent ATPase
MAIVDRDGSPMSRQYADHFIHSRYCAFRGYVQSNHQIDRLLTAGTVRAVIVIPEHFQENLLAGKSVEVQTLIDGSMPNRSQLARGYVIAINSAENKRMAIDYVARYRGITRDRAEQLIQPLKLEVRYLYNQASRSIWTVAPTMIMLVLMVIPPFYTTVGVVREKESGAIYNIYASTVTRLEFLVGKLIPYVAISYLNAFFLFLLAIWFFGAPFKGDLLFLSVATFVYVICTTAIGLTVSVFVRTQIAAQLITGVLTILPSFAYSGLLKPVAAMDPTGQFIAHLLPAMYYTEVVQGTFLKGLGWRELWPDVVVLMFYAAVLLTLSLLAFRKRPSR